MTTLISDLIVKPTVKFYKRQILKDPFHVAVKQWKRDRGDANKRFDYALTEQSLVLDVGGYVGDFANSIVQQFGCRVMVFEPMPAFYQQCASRFASNPRIAVHGFGLGSCDEELRLSDSDDASSFFRQGRSDGTVIAQVRDIAKVWQELGLERVDLMKINIEGGEYPLLGRMIDQGLAQRVNNLQIQFHDFVDDAVQQRTDLRDALRQTHEETWCYPFVWENWKRKNDIG